MSESHSSKPEGKAQKREPIFSFEKDLDILENMRGALTTGAKVSSLTVLIPLLSVGVGVTLLTNSVWRGIKRLWS